MLKKLTIIFFVLIFSFIFSGCTSTKQDISTVSIKNLELNIDFCNQFIEKGKYFNIWSQTKPKVNLTHIFCGQINFRGKPVGFHSKINGKLPITVKILKIINKNSKGIYQAQIQIYDIKFNIRKSKFSTIFPDNLTFQQVLNAIVNAYNNRYYLEGKKFRGPSGLGFDIQGYLLKSGYINTAYPIFTP